MDRDRSEWTSACSAHLHIEGKSNHVMHMGLSKTLASSKLGVPDVLANQKAGRVMSEFPLFWFNIEAFRTIPMVGTQFASRSAPYSTQV